MVTEDLDFVRGLFATDKQSIFANAFRTLFKAGSFISMVASRQDDVLGSSDLSREEDELRERCESLLFENSNFEKQLAKLRAKIDVVNSLREEVN